MSWKQPRTKSGPDDRNNSKVMKILIFIFLLTLIVKLVDRLSEHSVNSLESATRVSFQIYFII